MVMKKIAVTGSTMWENRVGIKDLLFDLKKRFGKELVIYSGGLKAGVDIYVRKFCMEFDIELIEVPPRHYQWNYRCLEPSYKYGVEYKANQIYIRNELLAKTADYFFVFIDKDDSTGIFTDLVSRCNKKKKKNVPITN